MRFLATTVTAEQTEILLLSVALAFIIFALFVLWVTKGKFK